MNSKPSHAKKRPEDYLEFINQVSPHSDPISVFLFVQIVRANHQLMQGSEKQLATAGLSWAKFRLLLDLYRHEMAGSKEGLQPSDLSAAQNISRNTISALIASLEKDHLLSRELHGTDRRKFIIRLTPRGRQVLKSKLDTQFRYVTECFAVFNAAQRETLYQFLQQLNANLQAQE